MIPVLCKLVLWNMSGQPSGLWTGAGFQVFLTLWGPPGLALNFTRALYRMPFNFFLTQV